MNNGVKQDAVLSAVLYCIYMNDLYKKIREKRPDAGLMMILSE